MKLFLCKININQKLHNGDKQTRHDFVLQFMKIEYAWSYIIL